VERGIGYLRKACEQDSPKACARLGLELAAVDPVEARPLLEAACKSNYSETCAALKKLGKAPKGGKKPGKKK
jgi:TPR repeat protein